MGALWGNLLTKLKHIKVKHKAVSPHLIRDSRGGQKDREVIKTFGGCLQRNINNHSFFFSLQFCRKLRLNSLLDFCYVAIFYVGANTHWWIKLLDL